MAKQTIIVMSDSHGDSLIVEEISWSLSGESRCHFFTMVTLNSVQTLRSGKASMSSKEIWTFMLATQNGWWLNLVRQDHPDAWTLVWYQFQLSKVGLLGSGRRCRYLSLWSLACAKCLDGRQDSFSKSRLHQPTTRDYQRMSLCSSGDWWQLF